MFFFIYKYRMRQLFHDKNTMLWCFLFGLALATLFYVSFGKLMTEQDTLAPVPVAVISDEKALDEEQTYSLKQLIWDLSEKEDDPILAPVYVSELKAKEQLSKKKLDGIIYLGKTPKLIIREEGINATILNTILTQYMQKMALMEDVIKNHPEKAASLATQISEDTSFIKEEQGTNNSQNSLIQYFYALIAMVCLYGCMQGMDTAHNLLPHLSQIGARKLITPVHKMKLILAEVLASITVNYLSVLLLYFYLIVVLRIDMGSRIPEALLVSLVGSIIGVTFGLFTGSIGKFSKSTAEGITMSICMTCCFLGGLMVNSMPNLVSHVCPLINKINPAVLLSDSFMALDIYPDHSRYFSNLLLMLAIAAIFCIGSYLNMRKKTY